MDLDPLPASRSCLRGRHEGKEGMEGMEGMEWKVSRVPDRHGVAAHQPKNLKVVLSRFGILLLSSF
jgi:hypothetical protein